MIIQAVKTPLVTAGSTTIHELLDAALAALPERAVVAVTSKVVSLCEGRAIPVGDIDKDRLIAQEADFSYEPDPAAPEPRCHYTILHNTLIPTSGIDESNGNGSYVLWPRDPQASANQIRRYLVERFRRQEVGVIITDSTIFPSRWGTMGMAIAHSGFLPIKDYIGTPDLFGRTLRISQANIAGGLAAAAVACMGEGAEQTPIAVMEDIPFVAFQASDPTPEAWAAYYVSPLEDKPFAPFFNSVPWRKNTHRGR